ncbi:MAG: sirohydrochlorin chelatase [Cyanobacteria bacterium P01_H01_bin.26]
MTSTAYLLISHGSRDPRHQAAANRLAQLVRERLNPTLLEPWNYQSGSSLLAGGRPPAMVTLGLQDSPRKDGLSRSVTTAKPRTKAAKLARLPKERLMVGTANLDFGLFSLHRQICEFGRRLSSAGVEQLHLVPLFLLRGKHVMEDIPNEVEKARKELGGTIELTLGEHIGGSQMMPALISNRLLNSPTTGRLIVAHGSRRARGNRTVDNLAKSLGTTVAYWTTESDIENQTIHLMQQGCSTLTIFPYFLFAGGITDAVAHLTEELAERFPRTNFRLLPPLGATADLANLILNTLDQDAAPCGSSRNGDDYGLGLRIS